MNIYMGAIAVSEPIFFKFVVFALRLISVTCAKIRAIWVDISHYLHNKPETGLSVYMWELYPNLSRSRKKLAKVFPSSIRFLVPNIILLVCILRM